MKQILLFFFSIVTFALNAQVISLTTSTGPRGFNVDEIRVVRTAGDGSGILSYGNPLVTFFVTQTPAQIVTASCNKLFSVTAVESVNGVTTNVPLVVNRMLIGNIQANLAGFAVITYKTPPAINIVTNQSYVTVAALADDCSGGTGGSLDSYVLDTVTQTAHGFRVMDAVLDTSSTSTSKFIKGNTSNQNRLPSHLVVDSLSANLFVVQRAGYVKKIQTRFTARQVYYLRDDGSYASTPDSTYNFPVFAITSSTTPIYLTPIVAGSGGAGTPGGSNTQVQFNNAGAFGGASTFTWNGTTLSAPALTLSGNGRSNNFIQGYATTTTASGTTTLTVNSPYLQFFTGSLNQTLVLPVASTLTLGHQFYIRNNSTGSITVQASGGNGVIILGPNTRCIVTCILASGTDASSWSAMYMGLNVASGKVLALNNSLTLTGTDGSTIDARSGGSIAYQDAINTFTQNQIFTLPTLTGSSATNSINITQTWNTTGAPSLLNVDLTNTASSGNARLFNFRIAGTSRFSMTPTAQLILGSNITLYPGLTLSGVGGSANGPYFNVNTTSNADYPGYSLNVTSTAINNNVNPAVATNFAGGLNVSPGVFGINYTGANTIDYRPVNIAYTINNLNVNSRTATGIFLNTTETALNGMTHNLMDLQVGGSSRFRVDNSGNIYSASINATTISATANIALGGGNFLRFTGKSALQSPVDGNLVISNSAISGFGLLQFGGITSLFSALQTASLTTGTCTFTNATAAIAVTTMSPILRAGDIVVFTNSGGALPTSLSLNTEYYVVGTPTATSFQVATSLGGTAIVHNGAGTGTHTVTRPTSIYSRNGNNSAYIPIATGKHSFDATNTASGTTGDQTINKPSGTVNFAAAATSLVVTNSLVSTSSIVYAVVRTNDTTAVIKNVVPANGSFTINLNAAATAETSVGFVVFN